MATLLLQSAGAALGGLIGGPFGAIAGRALGAVAGGLVDQKLFGQKPRASSPRPRGLEGLGSSEGAGLPRVYGKARLGGQIIWATRFEAVSRKVRTKGAAGGGGGGAKGRETTYYANLAIALCEGQIARVRRIWADGREIETPRLNMRVYQGTKDQNADPLIIAKEGSDNAPSYRGVAYVVIEKLDLTPYGNRIPQLSFEVLAPCGGLGSHVRAINLIPGAGEFAYEPASITSAAGQGAQRQENTHILHAPSDWHAALDDLEALCPNLKRVQLVVTWFGDDLRAGHCTVRPKVEAASKTTTGGLWQVSGIVREQASVVSTINDRPSYGGTPSDASVIRAIQDLKARGFEVILYPFIMMDIAAGNALPNPYTGTNGQSAYPWRGEITCYPARGVVGSVESTAAADTQVASFFGNVATSAFNASGTTVACTSSEWSMRRQILHYAKLAVLAGGVDGIIIGTEMVGLTRVRGAGGVYPATSHWMTLASDVRAILICNADCTEPLAA